MKKLIGFLAVVLTLISSKAQAVHEDLLLECSGKSTQSRGQMTLFIHQGFTDKETPGYVLSLDMGAGADKKITILGKTKLATQTEDRISVRLKPRATMVQVKTGVTLPVFQDPEDMLSHGPLVINTLNLKASMEVGEVFNREKINLICKKMNDSRPDDNDGFPLQ